MPDAPTTLNVSQVIAILASLLTEFGDVPILCGGKARNVSEGTIFALKDYADPTKYNIHIEGV